MTSGPHGHMQGSVSRMLGHSLQNESLFSNGLRVKILQAFTGGGTQMFSKHVEAHFQADTIFCHCTYVCFGFSDSPTLELPYRVS